jgi:hypothetical protein
VLIGVCVTGHILLGGLQASVRSTTIDISVGML